MDKTNVNRGNNFKSCVYLHFSVFCLFGIKTNNKKFKLVCAFLGILQRSRVNYKLVLFCDVNRFKSSGH